MNGGAVLKIADIRVEPAAAARGARLDQGKIEEYAAAYVAKDALPLPVVFQDGDGVPWLGDGLHRLRALSRLGRVSADVDLRQGSRSAAEWHAAGANGTHGLPLTREQRRLAVQLALRARPEASDRQIAEHCHCSYDTVARVRREMPADQLPDSGSSRTGKDGKTRKLPQRKPAGQHTTSVRVRETDAHGGSRADAGGLQGPVGDGGGVPALQGELGVGGGLREDSPERAPRSLFERVDPTQPHATKLSDLTPSQQADLRLAANPVFWRGETIRGATARQVVEAAEAGVLPASDALLELERRLGAQEQEIAALRETIAGMTPDPENDDRDAELNAAQAEALDLRAKVRDLEEVAEVQRQAHERDVIASLRGRARTLGEADRASATTRTPEQVLAALRIDGVLQVYTDARGPVDGSALDQYAADLGRRHAARRPYSRPEVGIFLRDLAGLSGAESLHLPAAEIERLRQIYLAARKAAR